MQYHCELIDQPEQVTLSIRTHSAVKDLAEVLPRCYRTIGDYLAEIGQKPGGAPFAAYHNMDMDNLDIEAGVPIAKKLPGKGEIQPGAIAAEKAASTVHVGPYSSIPEAWASLGKWMEEQGLEPIGVAYEIYVDDPMEVAPEALKTQVVMPVKVK